MAVQIGFVLLQMRVMRVVLGLVERLQVQAQIGVLALQLVRSPLQAPMLFTPGFRPSWSFAARGWWGYPTSLPPWIQLEASIFESASAGPAFDRRCRGLRDVSAGNDRVQRADA